MLTEICQYLKNWFTRKPDGSEHPKYYGDFIIADGALVTDKLVDGQYFRILGSLFNDGVHRFGDGSLYPETFVGEVWAMHVPPAVVDLDAEIDAWIDANQDVLNSPYQSESFSGYSYVKAGGALNGRGSSASLTWQDHFSRRLVPWKKVCVI